MQHQIPLRLKILTPFLRSFYDLLYHQFAWTYDFIADLVSIGLWKQWILSVLPYLSGTNVLEIGHGPGHLLVEICQNIQYAIGVDRSPQMGRIAYHRLKNNRQIPRLIQAEAQNIPLKSKFFDNIVTTFPSEYILLPATISECYRVLKPGGLFILLPFAWITGKNPLHKAAAWLFKITGETPTPDSIAFQSLADAGFSVKAEYHQMDTSKVLIVQAHKPPK